MSRFAATGLPMRLSHVLIAAAAAACVSALLVLTFERPGDVQKSDKATATVGEALSERWPSRDLAAMTPKQAADSRKIADRIAPLVKAEPAPASAAVQEPAKSAPLAEASGEEVTETKAAPEVAPAPPSALRIRAARARATETAAKEETVVKSKAASNGVAKNRLARKTAVKNSAKSATANSAKSPASPRPEARRSPARAPRRQRRPASPDIITKCRAARVMRSCACGAPACRGCGCRRSAIIRRTPAGIFRFAPTSDNSPNSRVVNDTLDPSS